MKIPSVAQFREVPDDVRRRGQTEERGSGSSTLSLPFPVCGIRDRPGPTQPAEQPSVRGRGRSLRSADIAGSVPAVIAIGCAWCAIKIVNKIAILCFLAGVQFKPVK